MNHRQLLFSGMFFLLDNHRITLEEFKSIIPEKNYTISTGNKIQSFRFEYAESFLKISFENGSAKPRNPIVINVDTQEQQPNPRQANQVEPKEYFALLDFETCMLWLSNARKKSMLVDFFQEQFGNRRFILKDVFDEAEFIKALRKLDDIKFSAVPNLFNQISTLTEALGDELNQYEAAEASIHLKYHAWLVGPKLMEKVKSLFRSKNGFQYIMISGRDERNLGIMFNNNQFSRKIVVDASVDDNEMCDPDDVFFKLITRIDAERNGKS